MAEEIIRTEVCIVGAGPAGAAASIELSKSGIPHLIIDADTFPRHKPCGDILTSGVIRALNRLNPEILAGLKKEGQLSPVWKTLIYPPNGKAISLDFLPLDGKEAEASCYSVSRYDLDLVLVNHIKASPCADFREGCRIKSIQKSEEGLVLLPETGPRILARLVLFATGSGSNLLARLGMEIPQNETAIGIRALYEGVEWPSEETALFLHPDCMPGGLYITPLPGGKCNVNLVMSTDKVRSEKQPLREKMEAFLASDPILKNAFSQARRLGNPEGSRLYLGIRPRKVSGEGFLLAGDAAGLIEFFSGNGIPQAYSSGQLAATFAVKALHENNFSAAYLQRYDQALYKKIRLNGIGGRILFPLLHRSFFSGLVLRFLNHLSSRPQTNSLLRNLLYEKNPARILRKPGFYYDLLLKK